MEIEINLKIQIEEIAKSLNKKEALELIKKINEVQEDWSFTFEIFSYFIDLFKEQIRGLRSSELPDQLKYQISYFLKNGRI